MKKLLYTTAIILLPVLALSQDLKQYPAQNEMTGLAFNGVGIYPNPSNGQFRVLFVKNNYINASIEVFDNMGKRVFGKDRLNVNPVQVDLSLLQPGIYILKISAANKMEYTTQKVVIAK